MNNTHFQIESNICVHIKMYCALSRLYYLLISLLIALGCVCFVRFISTYNVEYTARATISTSGIYIKRHRLFNAPWKYIDHEHLIFSLHSDLRNLFDGNVRKLVVSLVAVYETTDSLEQLILWDRTIFKKDDAKLNYKDESAEYSFRGGGNEGLIRGPKNVTLYLSCNIMHNIGNVPTIIAQDSHSFEFPDVFSYIMYR